MFLYYAEDRPNSNISNIMENTSHQGKSLMGDGRKKEEVEKVNIVDISSI
jgi:hypothetical protein